MPKRLKRIDDWIQRLKKLAAAHQDQNLPLAPPIKEFKEMVDNDLVLRLLMDGMFIEAALLKKKTPLGTAPIENFAEFVQVRLAFMYEWNFLCV